LFALFFAGLLLLHAPLLRLPYFWDEAGYYIPVARDLLLTGSPIPQSTPSNAHPPLVMAWLALVWRVFRYSTLVTHTAMVGVAAFSLLGLFQLARAVANPSVAGAVAGLTALYPVFFIQSSLAQVDLAAAGFTYWALLAYVEDRPWILAFWFSLAGLAKETAIVAPLALFGWVAIARFIPLRWKDLLPPVARRTRALHLLIPVVPLACWFAYHRAKTGFVLGNPEFLRYNLSQTLSPLRIPFAFGMRLWQGLGYFGLYLLSLAGLLAMFRPAQREAGTARPRIAIWQQAVFAVVLLAYLALMSVAGGAVLARYLLPVTPLVILAWVATLWRRVRYWSLIVGAVAIAFVAGWFSNPPYAFSLEDNFAYRDYVVLHAEASRFLAMNDPSARVLTAWPASDELSRPWLGYVARPFRIVRIEDFTPTQIALASAARGQFDVALVFSTKYRPPHELLEEWTAWTRIKEKFFGYHRDLLPDDIAKRLGGRVIFHKEANGQWVAVIAPGKEQDARLRAPGNPSPGAGGTNAF
jgi:hypothetical protein